MATIFQRAFHLAQRIWPSGGVCLEFGVYTGGTYLWQVEQILSRYPDSRLIGFDSWQGLPAETDGVWHPERHQAGNFSAAKAAVTEPLRELTGCDEDPRFRFVDGFYSESLTHEVRNTIADLIFVNIDVDIYRSTIELLDFVGPCLRPGVVLYWDDWKDPRDNHSESWGEHLAWDAWRRVNPGVRVETIEVNPINQRIMVVTSANGVTAEDVGFSVRDARSVAFKLTSSAGQPAVEDADYQRFLRLKNCIRKLPGGRRIGSLLRRLIKSKEEK